MDKQETQERRPQASAPVEENSRSRYRAFIEWLGLGKDGERTGLDLLQVLAAVSIPVAVVVMGSIFTGVQNSSQQQAEQQRAQAQLDVEEQRAQDEALQAYLEEMGRLLLNEELNSSEEGAGVQTLARARTLTILERVDNDRKSSVVRFLIESKLVGSDDGAGEPIIALKGADLSGVDLAFAPLAGADLSGVDLRGADLRSARLNNASMVSTQLDEADLRGASMHEADLSGARMLGADLTGAFLAGAIISNDQLNAASSLNGVVSPNGLITGGNGLEPALGYALVEHDSGTLAVEVPSTWSDTITEKDATSEGADVDPGEGIGPGITATTDLETWADARRLGVPGVYILATKELASYTEDDLLDSRLWELSSCETGTRQNFDRSPYSGKMQWADCGVGGGNRLVLAAAPTDRQCTVIMQLVTYSEADREAARHILDTFAADCQNIESAGVEGEALRKDIREALREDIRAQSWLE